MMTYIVYRLVLVKERKCRKLADISNHAVPETELSAHGYKIMYFCISIRWASKTKINFVISLTRVKHVFPRHIVEN